MGGLSRPGCCTRKARGKTSGSMKAFANEEQKQMRMGKEGGPVHNDGEFSLCPLKILKVSDVSLRSSEKRHDTSSVARHKFHVYGSVDSAV